MDHFSNLFVSVLLSGLFLAALCSSAGNVCDLLVLLYVMFSCVLFHFPIWCPGSGVVFLYRFQIFVIFLTL